MKFIKFLGSLALMSAVFVFTFNFTYEKVSATEMVKDEAKKKNEVTFKKFLTEDDLSIMDYINSSKENSTKNERIKIKTDNYIFVGDSRLEGMRPFLDIKNEDSLYFVTSDNIKCDWFRNKALSEINKIISKNNTNYNIVFTMGINDLDNVDRYIEFFNYLSKLHTKHNIFVTDINPIDEYKYMQNGLDFVNSDDIYRFNISLKKNLSENVYFINTYQELICNEFGTEEDGYTYTDDTYFRLAKFIINNIQSR